MPRFSYGLAFDRNLGWVTEWEQQALRGKRVAIAGMGGVGGVHLLTLARLGIGAFNVSDLDRFELVNFNRQIGATMETLHRPKVEVMAEMALAINPEAKIRQFPDGVTPETIDDFLHGVDLFVDGFDFFVLDIRRKVFARCAELGIPAVTAAPIGMGTGFLAFVPGGMSFEQYFRLEGQPEVEQYLRFLMGVVPRGLHRAYLVDPTRINLAEKRGPSTSAACQLCAGVTATMAVKLLLRRGDVRPAPWHHHFDAYRDKLVLTRLPRGNAGPAQRAKLALARRMLRGMARKPAPEPFRPSTPLEEILSLGRWAPSGDNVQHWRFEITGPDSVTVHLTTEAGTNPYEIRGGEPSLLSGGMLLETLRIAATFWDRTMEWEVVHADDPYRIAVRFHPQPGIEPDPLFSFIPMRSVDRRAFRRRPLRPAEKQALAAATQGVLAVDWHEPVAKRLAFARLSARATDIRLRSAEAFGVHQKVIDWRPGSSASGIPAAAIGVARTTLGMMRWAMQDWSRMQWLNRLGATRSAAAEMDYRPGLGSAAYFTLRPAEPLPPQEGRVDALLRLGQAVQRFWLTATRLGLAIQPSYATIVFAHYGERGTRFTTDESLLGKSRDLARAFHDVTGATTDGFVYMGRIGEPFPRKPTPRSVRRELPDLLIGTTPAPGGEPQDS